MFGHPIDLLVQLDHAVFDCAGFDEPCWSCHVKQRRGAAPAERISVRHLASIKEQPAFVQVLDDARVGIFYEDARPVMHRSQEATLVVDGHDEGQVIMFGDFHVFHAESRGNVHQSGAVFGGDIIGVDHVMCWFFGQKKGKQRRVFLAAQGFSLHGSQNAVRTDGKNLFDQVFRHDQFFFAHPIGCHQCVFHVRVRSDSHVTRQRPGRGCPDQQAGVFFIDERETYIDARIFGFFISLRDLMV